MVLHLECRLQHPCIFPWGCPSWIPVYLSHSPQVAFHAGKLELNDLFCQMSLVALFLLYPWDSWVFPTCSDGMWQIHSHMLHPQVNVTNRRTSSQIILLCWIAGCLSPLMPAVLLTGLSFCGSSVVNHFCDILPLLQLAHVAQMRCKSWYFLLWWFRPPSSLLLCLTSILSSPYWRPLLLKPSPLVFPISWFSHCIVGQGFSCISVQQQGLPWIWTKLCQWYTVWQLPCWIQWSAAWEIKEKALRTMFIKRNLGRRGFV